MNKNFMQDMQGLGNDMQQFSELHGTDQVSFALKLISAEQHLMSKFNARPPISVAKCMVLELTYPGASSAFSASSTPVH